MAADVRRIKAFLLRNPLTLHSLCGEEFELEGSKVSWHVWASRTPDMSLAPSSGQGGISCTDCRSKDQEGTQPTLLKSWGVSDRLASPLFIVFPPMPQAITSYLSIPNIWLSKPRNVALDIRRNQDALKGPLGETEKNEWESIRITLDSLWTGEDRLWHLDPGRK